MLVIYIWVASYLIHFSSHPNGFECADAEPLILNILLLLLLDREQRQREREKKKKESRKRELYIVALAINRDKHVSNCKIL